MKPNLASKKDCTGCGACASVCSHSAIEIKYDKNGYLMPVVKEENCIGCHLCEQRCPILNLSKLKFHPSKDIRNFSAWSNDDEVCLHATSGGIFSQLAIDTLQNNNSSVFGAHLTDKNTVYHLKVNRKEDLHLILGTKYIQSDASSAYRECKQDIKAGKKVLFCGTPCQIAGLYATLGFKDYENLLTTELICHGVGSRVAAEVATAYYKADYIVSNRDKRDGWVSATDRGVSGKSVYSKEGKLFRPAIRKDIFYPCFGNTHRISCTRCYFARINRIADISLGDQWGLYKQFPERFKLGVSLILINTTKGLKAIQSPQITAIENTNKTLDAYPLFYPSVSRWCTLAPWLGIICKFPQKIIINVLTLNWKRNPLLIPYKLVWMFFMKKQLKEVRRAIKRTKIKEGWE